MAVRAGPLWWLQGEDLAVMAEGGAVDGSVGYLHIPPPANPLPAEAAQVELPHYQPVLPIPSVGTPCMQHIPSIPF